MGIKGRLRSEGGGVLEVVRGARRLLEQLLRLILVYVHVSRPFVRLTTLERFAHNIL